MGVDPTSSIMEILDKPTVIITWTRYDALLRAEAELDALHAHGVDNWCGYGDAMDGLEESDG